MTKIKFFNIDYLFESDERYAKEYIDGLDYTKVGDRDFYDTSYADEIAYLDTIREIVIEFYDNDLDKNDLHESLENQTGEYICDFEYEIISK